MIRLLPLLLLAGCTGTVVQVPVSDLRAFSPITMSCRDTAETRQQIVKHNSKLDTLKTGKKVLYKDDCPLPVPKTKKEPPKTS